MSTVIDESKMDFKYFDCYAIFIMAPPYIKKQMPSKIGRRFSFCSRSGKGVGTTTDLSFARLIE
jgi:hypothetical protein